MEEGQPALVAGTQPLEWVAAGVPVRRGRGAVGTHSAPPGCPSSQREGTVARTCLSMIGDRSGRPGPALGFGSWE